MAALVRPQVVAAALLLLAAAIFAALPRGPERPEPPIVDLDALAAPPIVSAEFRLVLIDRDGLEWPRFVQARFPDSDLGRLDAVLAALRTELVPEGAWPRTGDVPTVFVGEVGVRRFAVLDFGPGFDGLEVATERQLLSSLVATLRVEGIDTVRLLREGVSLPAPFGHLTVAGPL